MTDETPLQPPDPGGLQFDRVESTQPIVAICSGCKGPLGDTYYVAGPARICVRCRDGIQGHLGKGSATARFFKAALLGILAAAVGGSIWAYITYKSEGTVYGLVAIGLGIALVLPNVASAALGSALPEHIGKASGANSTFRQLGSVFGIAIAVLVFDRAGSYASPGSVVDGARAALFVAAAVGVLGAVAALGIPARGRKQPALARTPYAARSAN